VASHWVVRRPFHLALKIVSVIVCAFVSVAIVGTGFVYLVEAIFYGRLEGEGGEVMEWFVKLLDKLGWLIGILSAALGGYVGYWLIPNKDK
jgi:hypothetical protein